MLDQNKLWETVLNEIEMSSAKHNLTWFKETYISKIDEGVVFLCVPSIFIQEWVYKKFHNEILKLLRIYNESVRALEYIIGKESDKKKQQAEQKTVQNQMNSSLPLNEYYVNKDDNLNPKYTFENFVVGPFNELAHTASQAIIKNPGGVYNPLFIYGDTGRGKTHLMQAIGNHIKMLHPNKKVFYLTSERFGSEFSLALQNGKANDFKEKYRKYDVIIMDDIQFFSSKEKFQEELFHLFNTFHNTNRQLVFSSDKHPNVIPGLEDRLKSRFGQGMIVDIPEPDLESRISILNAKSRLMNILLEQEQINALAEIIEGNIRELEGALNSISCQIQLKGRPLSILEIKNLLKNSAKPKKNISIKDIIKTIADFYNIDEESIYDKTRKKEVVKPRQIIMYILREDFNISYPSIGEKLGGRDHTTVIHSCEKIKNDIKTNNFLSEELSQIRAMI